MNVSQAGMSVLFLLLKTCPLLLICTHAFLESRAAHRFAGPSSGPAAELKAYSSLWLISCLSFCLYELAAAYQALSFPAITPLLAALSALGTALFACGVFLRLSAIRELKAAFGTPPWAAKGVSVKTDSFFAWVRHPSELGLVLICLGLALAGNSLAVFAAFAFILFPLMLLRIKQEERWLMRQTQGAYASYAASVPCLFPISLPAGRTPNARPDGQGTGLAQG
jgi:protein-S-isoprenylcysteine O-methyltransferase Ste14